VWSADARSAQIGGPEGISHSFQVSAYSGEPFPAILVRNLLSSDHWRVALGDEAVKSGPEVSLIGMASARSSARKRLTRTGTAPDGSGVGPSSEPKSKWPSADSSEEMALDIALEVIRSDIDNAPFVNITRRDQVCRD
jgi:hypothetical protein